MMRKLTPIFLAGVIVLGSCNDTKNPSDANFRKAINQDLAKHGEVCTVIGRQFPVDVSEPERRPQSWTASQVAVLEHAGLVHSSNTTAVVRGMMDALRGPTPPQPVKRYELTADGQKYFRQTPGIFGQSARFCYGQKAVDSILKWTKPVTAGADSQSEVTYTYRIANLAPWAERPDVQHVFWDVRTTVEEISKSSQVAGVQLTNHGWEVPGQ